MLNLSKTQIALFSLIGKSIGTDVMPLPEGVDWIEVIRESIKQSVQIIVFSQAKEWCDDQSIIELLDKKCDRFIHANMTSAYAAGELNALLRKNGYSYMILKGIAAASYYPNMLERMLGDVDFLIETSLSKQVEDLLLQNGYEKQGPDEHRIHTVLSKHNQKLEMHYGIPGVPDGTLGKIVQKYMSNALMETKEVELFDSMVCTPSPEYHGLILFLHMQHHMLREGIGLRHLMDVAMYVERTGEDAFWERRLLPCLKEIGLLCYAKTIVKTCSVYFGTKCPDWAQDADDALCDDLMSDVLAGGNFGRKNAERSKSGMMIGNQNTHKCKVQRLYQTLHKSSASYYPKLKSHKVLWFFTDCGRAIKYIALVIVGKRPSLSKTSIYADERKSVYDRLKIFEIE